MELSPGGDWALSGSASGWPVVCGFLTSCGKDFMSPGDFEGMFIKAGDSKKKEGLKLKEATIESRGGPLLWHPRNIIGKK